MALVQDIARFTLSTYIHKVEPATPIEWSLIHTVLREKVGE